MRHTIIGQRREDRARRTIIVGTAAAVLPVVATAAAIGRDWEMSGVVLASMLSTIAAAAVVGVLLARITRRMLVQARRFDEERRHWRDEAHTDPLCGIANRRGAYEAVERYRATAGDASRWTVLALDIDRFKAVNDQHGHAVGDRVLTSVARTLTDHLPAGASVARWGGDEFVVFLLGEQGLPDGWIEEISEAVRSRPVPCREGDLHVAVSVGLAQGPACNQFDDVLAIADDELMRAKANLRANANLRRPIELSERERTIALDTRTLDARRPVVSRRAGEARSAGAWSA